VRATGGETDHERSGKALGGESVLQGRARDTPETLNID